jgi:hypothetical protein
MVIPVLRITASSHYQSAKYGPDGLGPEQVLLDSPRFGGWLSSLNAWQDSWLRFEFAQSCLPTRLMLKNGFIEPEKNRERDDFYYHLRARHIRLSTEHETLDLELADDKEVQTLLLSLSQPTDRITLHILDVYRDSPDGKIQSHDVVGLGAIRWST